MGESHRAEAERLLERAAAEEVRGGGGVGPPGGAGAQGLRLEPGVGASPAGAAPRSVPLAARRPLRAAPA
ncbi:MULTISPECIES: hypothetical protein [unclassified Streptomyces]|uniref:hypothetical protein n=1 Tax=unclassified Streptomyces TaxID=2593676 RepID=UPI0033BA4D8B